MLKVLYEDNHLLVIEKPINVPSQADDSKDKDVLTLAKEYIKDKYQKPGNVYLGLVHRLDRPVGGVMVFAKTSKAASRLSSQIQNHQFEKKYLAVCIDNGLKERDELKDYLLKDTKKNMVKVDPKGKLAILNYEVIARKDNLALVKIHLKTGRSHQIRVQFASRNHSLYGDQRYNPKPKKGAQLALWSNELSFIHPISGERIHFASLPIKTEAFLKFAEILYGRS